MLSENLRRLRKEQRYNQTLLGKVANCSHTTIQNIEDGSNDNPRIKTLMALAKVLGVSVDDLIK